MAGRPSLFHLRMKICWNARCEGNSLGKGNFSSFVIRQNSVLKFSSVPGRYTLCVVCLKRLTTLRRSCFSKDCLKTTRVEEGKNMVHKTGHRVLEQDCAFLPGRILDELDP